MRCRASQAGTRFAWGGTEERTLSGPTFALRETVFRARFGGCDVIESLRMHASHQFQLSVALKLQNWPGAARYEAEQGEW